MDLFKGREYGEWRQAVTPLQLELRELGYGCFQSNPCVSVTHRQLSDSDIATVEWTVRKFFPSMSWRGRTISVWRYEPHNSIKVEFRR